MQTISEGRITLTLPEGKLTKKDPIFYNPVMALNRDLSLAVLSCMGDNLQVCDPLAGSGIRLLRALRELPESKIKHLHVNDYRQGFEDDFREQAKANGLLLDRVELGNEGATDFMSKLAGFDYCDLDPFGTPNPFLDMAIKRIARKGILAVTATDTSALCGTYPNVCKRKYWAAPLRTEQMHEAGLRILIRKVQLIGVQYEKALQPVFSYSKDHYMRVYFRCVKSKKACDDILKQHGMFMDAGPMWLGKIGDRAFVKKMMRFGKHEDFLEIIYNELSLDVVGLVDMHALAEELKLSAIPKTSTVMENIRNKGYTVTLTHLRATAFKTDMPYTDIKKLVKKIKNQ